MSYSEWYQPFDDAAESDADTGRNSIAKTMGLPPLSLED